MSEAPQTSSCRAPLPPHLQWAETLASESWGEILRVRQDGGKTLLAIAYLGQDGAALYEESRAGLERWTTLARDTCPALLKIQEVLVIEGGALLLVEDPGGPPLGAMKRSSPPALANQARMVGALAKLLEQLYAYDLSPVGVSPATIFYDSARPETRWRLAPVAPGAARAAARLAGGRYAAPELAGASAPARLNADVYSLGWLWAELAAGRFDLGRAPQTLETAIPYTRLRTVLRGAVEPRGGRYGEPRLLALAAQNYAKTEAEEDLREVAEAARAAGRTPWKQWVFERRRLLIQAGAGLALLIVILLALFALPRMFRAGNTLKTPYGAVNLYFESLAERDLARARECAKDWAVNETERLMQRIEFMENEHLASRFKKALPSIHGDGATRTVKADLQGENGDVFMRAEMTIRRQDSGDWLIDNLFFEELRTKENP